MISDTLSTILISIATTGVGGFFGWLFGRKETAVRIKGQEVDNFDKSIEAYKKMYEDIVEDLKTQVGDLKAENEELKNELTETRKQIMTLTNFVLASALQRADGNFPPEAVENLKKILQ